MSEISLLIAEDEAITRDFIKRVLANNQAPVSEIFEASDGREALALFERHRPGLVFLDIRMPYLDGLQVAEKIRARGGARVVIISAHDEFEYARSAFRLGVEDFLLKPVRPAELLRQIHKACEARAPAAPGGPAAQHPLLRAVAEYVEANLGGPLDLEAIASAACLSRSHLSRTFKKLAGRTIMEYVQERRLAEAGKLLAQSHLSVTEIGERTGFASPAYFAACFRKHFGLSPSEYRRDKAKAAPEP